MPREIKKHVKGGEPPPTITDLKVFAVLLEKVGKVIPQSGSIDLTTHVGHAQKSPTPPNPR